MKRTFWNVIPTILLVGWMTACGSSKKVETAKLEASFQSAAANIKTEVTQAATAIKAGDFGKAAAALKNVVKPGGLSPEQKDAISAVVAEMQMIASQDPGKYPIKVYESIGEVISVMEGQPILRRAPPSKP